MSEENAAIVRASVDRFNRDGVMAEELFDPEVELFNFREGPITGTYRGYEGLRKWRDDIFDVVDEGRFEIKELVDADEESAVVFRVELRGRARHTGIEMQAVWSVVQWLRDGRIYRTESYLNHAEALEAAGLSE